MSKSSFKPKVYPSIIAADYGHLADEAKRIEQAGADGIHVDIMDGHFVPNLTLGTAALAALNRATDLFLDVHIMVYRPFDYIERLVESGADCITFHFEATEDVEETLNFIKKCGVKAGLAFRPETSDSFIIKYLHKFDKVLMMTVNPGFGGQAFMSDMLPKVSFTRALTDKLGIEEGGGYAEQGAADYKPYDIEVDGGINLETAKECVKAGANELVVGTYLFEKGRDMAKTIEALKQI